MEEELLLFYLANLGKSEKKAKTESINKILLNFSDPFHLLDSVFIHTYGIPKKLCQKLILELKPFDKQTHTNLVFQQRFLAVLYYFTNGYYNRDGCNISQPSFARALHTIAELIVKKKSNVIRFPKKDEEIAAAKQGFQHNFDIKNTIGAIDCAHINIIALRSNQEENACSYFVNEHGNYSINVEAVCDHRSLFTSINAKYPGSCIDSIIWKKSHVRRQLIRNYCKNKNTWLLADWCYPQEPWIMKPKLEAIKNEHRKFNMIHSNAHYTIRKAFCALRTRFRCLGKQHILHYSHKKAANIIYACAILYNILLENGETIECDEAEMDMETNRIEIDLKMETEQESNGWAKRCYFK